MHIVQRASNELYIYRYTDDVILLPNDVVINELIDLVSELIIMLFCRVLKEGSDGHRAETPLIAVH